MELRRLRDALGQPNHAEMIFKKVFDRDIQRLLTMDELWNNRKRPVPLDLTGFKENENDKAPDFDLNWDQKPWSLKECVRVFKQSLIDLSNDLIQERKEDSEFTLTFDKDDESSLNFVTAAANIRAHIFHIELTSRFKVKGKFIF